MQRKHTFGRLKDCTLLYVEDDDATAFLFQIALRESGIPVDVYRVVDGSAALNFLNRTGAYASAPKPDLVVLDLNLPGKSGLDILAEIRSTPELRYMTVVMFSSSTRPDEKEACLTAGADAWFTKDPDLNAFIAAVEDICRRIPSGPVLKMA
jgi:two-component system response regulator